MRRRAAATMAALLVLGTAPSAVAGGSTSGAKVDAVECAPRVESQWIREQPFAQTRLGLQDAWSVARGQGVVVAVVDSGVEADNPHLQEAVVPGTTFVSGDPEPGGTSAVNNHGTAIASLIAGRRVPDSGLVGVAPAAKIMPVRVFASEEREDVEAGNGLRMDRVAKGIRWAADHGARVINVSLSTPTPDPALEAAVAHARARGALVVASAGNQNADGDAPNVPHYPAGYPGVLGVTATNIADRVTNASIHSSAVDVAAVGQEVVAAWFDQKDCVNSPGDAAPQTSWATGYVSGVAALVASAHPDASPDEIAYRIMASADRPVRGARDNRRGWGIVQPYRAMVMTLDPSLAGPPLPGQPPAEPPAASPERLHVVPVTDPLDGAQERVVWWVLLGAAGVGVLTLLAAWRRPTRS
jgi:type VII secretion-associated serine protease mycosin